MSQGETLAAKAMEALTIYFAYVIRNEIGEDPDHSGPEDAADALAEKVIDQGYRRLTTEDWKDLLE